MPHICTHTPAEPKFVLAIEITEHTYDDIYVPLASGRRGRTASFKSFDGRILYVPVDSEIAWAVVPRPLFDMEFEAVESWSKKRFTLCKANPIRIKEI